MSAHPAYPGYDVLAKRDTPSWNARTRAVIEERLTTPLVPRFLTPAEWDVADALCRRIVPGGADVPLVALLDAKLLSDESDGTRIDTMPFMREAWRRALAAIDLAAQARAAPGFASLDPEAQDALLGDMQAGRLSGEGWGEIDPQAFFNERILNDIPALFYSLPGAWSEIGFGGPASPRGYVRLDGDRRDAWEAAEAVPGDEKAAEFENRHVV